MLTHSQCQPRAIDSYHRYEGFQPSLHQASWLRQTMACSSRTCKCKSTERQQTRRKYPLQWRTSGLFPSQHKDGATCQACMKEMGAGCLCGDVYSAEESKCGFDEPVSKWLKNKEEVYMKDGWQPTMVKLNTHVTRCSSWGWICLGVESTRYCWESVR